MRDWKAAQRSSTAQRPVAPPSGAPDSSKFVVWQERLALPLHVILSFYCPHALQRGRERFVIGCTIWPDGERVVKGCYRVYDMALLMVGLMHTTPPHPLPPGVDAAWALSRLSPTAGSRHSGAAPVAADSGEHWAGQQRALAGSAAGGGRGREVKRTRAAWRTLVLIADCPAHTSATSTPRAGKQPFSAGFLQLSPARNVRDQGRFRGVVRNRILVSFPGP